MKTTLVFRQKWLINIVPCFLRSFSNNLTMIARIPTLLVVSFCCLIPARSSLTFRQTKECGFTLKLVRDMKATYSQMHSTDKYSQHSSIIWLVSLNGSVFVQEPSYCGFKSRCCHLNFRYGPCIEQEVPSHSGKLQSVDSL